MDFTRRTVLSGAAGWISGCRPVLGSPAAPDSAWLPDIYRELHLDAHFGQVQAPYESFDAERSAQTLKDAGFQMVSLFATCGAGYSYYPTDIGVPHPSLKRDFTGEFTASLKKRGVRVLAYVSVGPDRRFHRDHPAWIRSPGPQAGVANRGDMAMMCLQSPWVEQAHIPQLKEIATRYGVDGFFLDNLLSKFARGPCYCQYCREAFASEIGGDIPASDQDPKVFALHQWLTRNMERYAERVTASLAPAKPGLAFVFTHVWVTRNPVKPPPAVTQLVWEPVPPYPGVHSLDFSLEARYLSTQTGVANWSCMATRGNGWGDYSLRDPAAFVHEAAVLLAGGGRPYLADDSYPSGNPDSAVYQVYRDVNRRTAELEPVVKGCVPVKDVAVLLSAASIWSNLPLVPTREWMGGPSSRSVAGAHKVLVEEHTQFSILNSEGLTESLAGYKGLIIPEQCILSEPECAAIRRFVSMGGALIATGDTGTRDIRNRMQSDFSLADVLGIRYLGSVDTRRAFLRVRSGTGASGIPSMDVQVRGGYPRIQGSTAKTLMDLVPAAGPKMAPAEEPQGPGVTLNRFGKGQAIYCAAPLFSAYHLEGTPVLRKLAAWMLQLVHPLEARGIVLENAPLNVEVSYNSRSLDRFVHLVNFSGDKRMEGAQRLQDFSAVHGIRVRFRCAARPKRIALAPEGQPVAFEWKEGWASFEARPLVIHSAYMIEC